MEYIVNSSAPALAPGLKFQGFRPVRLPYQRTLSLLPTSGSYTFKTLICAATEIYRIPTRDYFICVTEDRAERPLLAHLRVSE